MTMKEMHEFEGVVQATTSNAVLVDVGEKEPVWLPWSQIEYDLNWIEYEKGDEIKMEVPEWLAIQKGML